MPDSLDLHFILRFTKPAHSALCSLQGALHVFLIDSGANPESFIHVMFLLPGNRKGSRGKPKCIFFFISWGLLRVVLLPHECDAGCAQNNIKLWGTTKPISTSTLRVPGLCLAQPVVSNVCPCCAEACGPCWQASYPCVISSADAARHHCSLRYLWLQ